MERTANGVVHPVTEETITKYKTLISDPLLQDNWTKGIFKELEKLSKGYGEKGD